MEIKIKAYSSLCELEYFEINGQEDADYGDFVDKYDHDEMNADDYACGDMRCDIKDCTPEVLKKYNIAEDEYLEIAEKVDEALSFGCCGWCV